MPLVRIHIGIDADQGIVTAAVECLDLFRDGIALVDDVQLFQCLKPLIQVIYLWLNL